jgi:hypothetical protein
MVLSELRVVREIRHMAVNGTAISGPEFFGPSSLKVLEIPVRISGSEKGAKCQQWENTNCGRRGILTPEPATGETDIPLRVGVKREEGKSDCLAVITTGISESEAAHAELFLDLARSKTKASRRCFDWR